MFWVPMLEQAGVLHEVGPATSPEPVQQLGNHPCKLNNFSFLNSEQSHANLRAYPSKIKSNFQDQEQSDMIPRMCPFKIKSKFI